MASLVIDGHTDTSITAHAAGLQFLWGVDNNYSQFYITVSGGSGAGSSAPVNPPSVGTSSSTPSVTKFSLAPNTTYTVSGIVTHSGTNTTVGTTTVTTDGPPNGMGTVSGSAASGGTPPSTITFTWSNPGRATSYNLSGNITTQTGYSSTSYTTTSLGAGTWTLNVTPVNSYGSGGTGSKSVTLATPPPPAPTLSGNTSLVSGNPQANLSWTTSSGATSYKVYRSVGSGWVFQGQPSGTTFTDTTIFANTTYQYSVTAVNSGGEGASSNTVVLTYTPVPLPTGTPTVTYVQSDVLGYTLSWSGVTGASSYEVTAQGTGGEFLKGTVSSSPFALHLDNYATTYTIRVKPKNSEGSYGNTGSTTITTTETTPPVATITITPHSTDVLVAWSIVDNPGPGDGGASGFHHMVVNISAPGGGSTYNVGQINTASGSFAFTSDGLGNPILPSTLYRFYFQVYDNQFNLAIVDRTTTTAAPTRPSNFAWTTAKVSGQPFNLTASEWTALANAVRAFRAYKSVAPYSFSNTGFTGIVFTAIHFNEMRSAIAGMSPPTSAPASVAALSPITALQLNRLRDSLNSIV